MDKNSKMKKLGFKVVTVVAFSYSLIKPKLLFDEILKKLGQNIHETDETVLLKRLLYTWTLYKKSLRK